MSRLYVVSTPIGNLKDITLRAIETLKSVDIIACEDTRKTKILCTEYGIQKPLFSLFVGKEKQKTKQVLEKLEEGLSVALASDAGTPNIQDPGYLLVAACHKKGIEVVSIPGPCALISALSISGLPTENFIYEGFLPVKAGPRKKKIATWKDESRTVVFYESPYKVIRTLENIREVLGDVRIAIGRELTKKFEEVLQGTPTSLLEHFGSKPPKGEFVILISKPNI